MLVFPMSVPFSTAVEIVQACLQTGDEGAWKDFVQRFQPLIASSVARVTRRYNAPNPALIDDLVQETYLRLCKDNCRLLREFVPRHDEAIFGYLKVVAASVALDYFRGRATQKRVAEVGSDGTEGEAITSSSSTEQNALLNELEGILTSSESERDCTIFWLYFRQGYTAKDIAAMPHFGLSQKGVESCIHRLTESLRTAVTGPVARSQDLSKGRSHQSALGVVE